MIEKKEINKKHFIKHFQQAIYNVQLSFMEGLPM